MSEKIILSWSGGKDSALALDRLLIHGAWQVAGLFTIYSKETGLVKLHNTPVSLIRKQAESLKLPLHELPLPEKASNTEYENAHIALMEKLREQGIHDAAFGDIFLEEIKQYRDRLSEKAKTKFHYPLWGRDSEELAQNFVSRGFKAIVTAINGNMLSENFLGRTYNEAFIADLPAGADICGENGEFHTFVFDGPLFSQPVKFSKGRIYEIDYNPEVNIRMKFLEIE